MSNITKGCRSRKYWSRLQRDRFYKSFKEKWDQDMLMQQWFDNRNKPRKTRKGSKGFRGKRR